MNSVEYVLNWQTLGSFLFTGGIFLIGFLSLLLVSFNALLGPIKQDIHRLEADIKTNKQELKADIKANKQDLKADIQANRQDLKADIQALNAKIDQLIVVVANKEHIKVDV